MLLHITSENIFESTINLWLLSHLECLKIILSTKIIMVPLYFKFKENYIIYQVYYFLSIIMHLFIHSSTSMTPKWLFNSICKIMQIFCAWMSYLCSKMSFAPTTDMPTSIYLHMKLSKNMAISKIFLFTSKSIQNLIRELIICWLGMKLLSFCLIILPRYKAGI